MTTDLQPIIEELENDNSLSVKQCARNHQINFSTLRNWILKAGRQDLLSRKQSRKLDAEKQKQFDALVAALEADPNSSPFNNLLWAFFYTSGSYLVSILIVLICEIFSYNSFKFELSFPSYILIGIIFFVAYFIFTKDLMSPAAYWLTGVSLLLVSGLLGAFVYDNI